LEIQAEAPMAAHAARLARIFTPTYAATINAQLVAPAQSQVVKPNELLSALARPLHVARYEPYRDASYLAASLSFGIIQGHPFMDGNKRTAFFLANEYLRACALPGLADEGKVGEAYRDIRSLAEAHISVAKGELDVLGLEIATKNR
jgi:prophage maintenance system killer protein